MGKFDLMNLKVEDVENEGSNVFFQNDVFKTRLIVLKAGASISPCQMHTFVIFFVVEGEVVLKRNEESSVLKQNQIFITEPALLSMQSITGARLLGIQIKTGQ